MASETYCGNCPTDVADALTSILRESLLLIRMAGNADDADCCVIEANHVHNLPAILRNYERSKLERYLSWAQTVYASDFQKRFNRLPTMFISQWQQLELYLKGTGIETKVNGMTASMNGTPSSQAGESLRVHSSQLAAQ